MEVIKLVTRAMGNILGSYFSSDMEVMSEEAQKIFQMTRTGKNILKLSKN
ncbi:hypothetical protein SAMN05216490_4429 [Mucilaginibacter mallensis]|uniref:Uncharacterized protein n=1 Tax=Mucilaginibacter mallensis TaxID=652787 RepID=A0A1H2BXG3_MUCMA|nr:hypothetical protein SAMN05216490_4429 [Mucilaginibacter mallensis]